MRIHYLQHVDFEGPGTIADWASSRGHEMAGIDPRSGEFPPVSMVDMLVILGGPMGAGQEGRFPWLAEEKRFIRKVVDHGALVFGVCLGAQLLSEVLGGHVSRNPEREIGWYPVERTLGSAGSRVFGGLPERFEALHWHGDTFTVPPGGVGLARSAVTEHQAFESDGGRLVGLQFHLEETRASLGALVQHAVDDLASSGEWVATPDELLSDRAPFVACRELMYSLLDAFALES